MKRPPWPVLYEDNHLLVVIKPAMLPTMGVAADRPSLLAQAKDYIREKYNKAGEVYLGIVSRLDAPVTGVLVLARTSKAASRLTRQFRERQVEKTYLALVPGGINPASGELEHHVAKDERHRKVRIVAKDARGASLARLTYDTIEQIGELSLLEIELQTGRKHQIRVQLAETGHPIVGDRKYGSRIAFPHGIALHARHLAFEHPVRKIAMQFDAPLPAAWNKHRRSLR